MIHHYKVFKQGMKSLLNEIFLINLREQRLIIFSLNANKFMVCKENVILKNILLQANIIIPDGQGIVWLMKKTGKNIPKIAGIDLMIEICQKATEKKKKIFLFGATEESNLKTKRYLEKKFPKIEIVGRCNGYRIDNNNIINDINKSKAEILFVALGSMRQEIWIIENKEKLTNAKIIQGVGGSFDVFAGKFKRAPNFLINIGLEWAYRLIKTPSKAGILKQLIKFLFYVISFQKKKLN